MTGIRKSIKWCLNGHEKFDSIQNTVNRGNSNLPISSNLVWWSHWDKSVWTLQSSYQRLLNCWSCAPEISAASCHTPSILSLSPLSKGGNQLASRHPPHNELSTIFPMNVREIFPVRTLHDTASSGSLNDKVLALFSGLSCNDIMS